MSKALKTGDIFAEAHRAATMRSPRIDLDMELRAKMLEIDLHEILRADWGDGAESPVRELGSVGSAVRDDVKDVRRGMRKRS